MEVKDNLFHLLRLAIGTDRSGTEAVDALRGMSLDEWKAVFKLADEHNVIAFAVDGWLATYSMSSSHCVLDDPENKDFRRSLIMNIYNYERQSDAQTAVISKLSDIWSQAGCRGMLLKGQSLSLLYPEPRHRATGDIDVFMLDGKYEDGNSAMAAAGARVDTHWYKHSQIHYKGQMIENHRYLVHTRDGKRGKSLDAALRILSVADSYSRFPGTEICVPPAQFNALFITYHGFAHFISEGMRFKQVLDWAVFLKAEWQNVNWQTLYQQCRRYHLLTFLDVMNDIAVNLLGVQVGDSSICTVSKHTSRVVDSVLFDRDFVFSSGQSGWKNRMHIVSNMFRYSWKYHRIAGSSVFVQLWHYATGYLFKSE